MGSCLCLWASKSDSLPCLQVSGPKRIVVCWLVVSAGKGKAGGHDHDADSVQDSCADAVAPAQDHKGHQQQEQQTQHAQQTPGKQQQQQPQHAGLSNGSSGWDPHEQRQGRDDASSKSSGGDGSMCQLHKQQHGKEHQPLVSRGSGDHQHHHRDVSSPGYGEHMRTGRLRWPRQ